MAKKDQDARERIIKAATEILNEVSGGCRNRVYKLPF